MFAIRAYGHRVCSGECLAIGAVASAAVFTDAACRPRELCQRSGQLVSREDSDSAASLGRNVDICAIRAHHHAKRCVKSFTVYAVSAAAIFTDAAVCARKLS